MHLKPEEYRSVPQSRREHAFHSGCRSVGRVGDRNRDRGCPVARLAPNRAVRAEHPGGIRSGGTLHRLGVLEQPATDDHRRRKPFWQIVDVVSGQVVADSTHYVFTLELKRLTWGPRACRSVVAEAWDQRTWNQPGDEHEQVGLLARGDTVPNGRYRIEAGWNGLDRRSTEIELNR